MKEDQGKEVTTWDEREEGCSHTSKLRRSCKDGRGRGSIERHEILELRAYQVPVGARMKHDAADAVKGCADPHVPSAAPDRLFRGQWLEAVATLPKRSRAGAMVGPNASAPRGTPANRSGLHAKLPNNACSRRVRRGPYGQHDFLISQLVVLLICSEYPRLRHCR
jgi:hypothetical protein